MIENKFKLVMIENKTQHPEYFWYEFNLSSSM